MTLYILFAGLGILVYAGVVYAETAASALSSAHAAFGLQVAFLASLLILFAADILFHANRLLRKHSPRVDQASAWRMRIVIAAVVFLAGSVAIVIAASENASDQLESAPIASKASTLLLNGAQAAAVDESARTLAAGRTLFQARGCVGCHRPDGTGAGPALHGLFGRPVEDPGCGVAFVDEWYVRDAILNPTATVAVGFPPIMPTFKLTEEELQALVVYVESLSPPVEAQRR